MDGLDAVFQPNPSVKLPRRDSNPNLLDNSLLRTSNEEDDGSDRQNPLQTTVNTIFDRDSLNPGFLDSFSNPVNDFINSLDPQVINTLSDRVTNLGNSLNTEVFDPLINSTTELVNTIEPATFNNFIDSANEAIKNVAPATVNDFIDSVTPQIENLDAGTLNRFLDRINTSLNNTVNTVNPDTLNNLLDSLTGAVDRIEPTTLNNFLDNITAEIDTLNPNSIDNFINRVTAVAETLDPTTVNNFLERASNRVQEFGAGFNPTALDSVINTIERYISEISDFNFINSLSQNSTQFLSGVNLTARVTSIPLVNLPDRPFFENTNLAEKYQGAIARATTGSLAGDFADFGSGSDIGELTFTHGRSAGGVRGLEGDDWFLSTDGVSYVVNGNQGNDKLMGGDLDDILWGGRNDDFILGRSGDDLCNGNLGNDTCYGEEGNDVVRGGQGDDILYGNEGNDIIIGDFGFDRLIGGTGADEFILRSQTADDNAANADRILDFNAAEGDRIKIAGAESLDSIAVAAVDINSDSIGDTAIIDSSDRVLGVVMSVDAATFNVPSSIFWLNPEDVTLAIVG